MDGRTVIVGGFYIDAVGHRIEYSREYVLREDGEKEQVGMTEIVRYPPQVVYFSKIHDPGDWRVGVMTTYEFSPAMAEAVAMDAKRADDGKLLYYMGCKVDEQWSKEALLDLAKCMGHRLKEMQKAELERLGI